MPRDPDPAQRVPAGAPLTRTCTVCTTAFTYMYSGGPKRQRCDAHTHPSKLGIRQRREAQWAAEDPLPEFSTPTGEPEPERACRECGTPTAAWTKGRPFCAKCRWLSVTCQNCGIDFDAARPRVAAQSPRTTCKSCSIRASRKKRAEDEAALAQLNARLGEEDARRVVRLVERVRQDVRVIRRDGDYDVLLVDGTPIKVRRAVGA